MVSMIYKTYAIFQAVCKCLNILFLTFLLALQEAPLIFIL